MLGVDPELWALDPDVTFLNHGSFGACPIAVLEAQNEIRAELESEPVRFMVETLPGLLPAAIAELAAFLGADPGDVVFVPNATHGVNSVLRSLTLSAGDELLVTDHEYTASRNALDFVAARSGARVVVVPVSFPGLADPEAIVDSVLAQVTPRTRLLLIDHVTSPTGVILPVERLVAALRERGVETLVDGAHAPGMLDLDLAELGAGYYTGNCHKWLCAPKGSAFLFVRRDLQPGVRPLAISHGATLPLAAHSRFQLEFGWTGTLDPSAYLTVPFALRYMAELVPGGWSAIRGRNHDLMCKGRALLCEALGVEPPCPESALGSLASVPLPDDPKPAAPPREPALQLALRAHGVQVPVPSWPRRPHRLVRISAQLYNRIEHYAHLARVLRTLLEVEGG
ncbi:MAG: aminotransferase class V-fold PLP-dependent enzyme [Planctomycetes bacterium]|nr:aminotransferase class V-fold PLP-dependent enzyme [Planctomycetota bacterium]